MLTPAQNGKFYRRNERSNSVSTQQIETPGGINKFVPDTAQIAQITNFTDGLKNLGQDQNPGEAANM